MTAACIMGLKGTALTPEERAFFADLDPWGFIVFSRNCETPDQVRALTAELRDVVGRNAPVFIDQEGGRVQRIGPPYCRAAPPVAVFGRLYEMAPEMALEACRLNHVMLAADLLAMGVDADCAPVLDIPAEDADPIIGDRAFGTDVETVTALGRAAIEGLEQGGCAAVIKHVPGHGRALVDSHLSLPVIPNDLETLRAVDFAPFKALAGRATMAMTAHVVLEAVDPSCPATISRTVMDEIVRGEIGFDGLVMTDDIDMKALEGSLRERVAQSFAAGCDMILHCTGDMDGMREAAEETPALSGCALDRARAAQPPAPQPGYDGAEASAKLAELMAPLERAA